MLKIRLDIKYLCAFLLILAIEVLIAVFTAGTFIRHHIGDVLVVVLIYCFIKSFIINGIKLLWLYIFIFAVSVEIGQYFNIVKLLGLSEHKLAQIVFGTAYDTWDIVCYFIGCAGICLFERLTQGRTAAIILKKHRRK